MNRTPTTLDSQLIATNSQIINSQQGMIETQAKLIEVLKQQLRIGGIISWDDPSDGE